MQSLSKIPINRVDCGGRPGGHQFQTVLTEAVQALAAGPPVLHTEERVILPCASPGRRSFGGTVSAARLQSNAGKGRRVCRASVASP